LNQQRGSAEKREKRCVINEKVLTKVKTKNECTREGGDWVIFETANAPTASPTRSKIKLPENSFETNKTIPANDFGKDIMYR
jgi:hypothetical protein